MNIRVIGLIGTDDYPHDYFMNYPVLGKIEEAYSIVETFNIQNVIIVNEEDSWKDRAIININSYARTKPNIYIVPSFYDLMLSKLKYFRLHDIPMIQIQNNPNSLFRTCIKRIFDITLATTLLTFNMPLFIIISIANKIASRGKIFYLQERLGKNKKPFKIIKFRTMYNNAEKKTGAVLAEKNDPRITKIGSFLRKTRFDELPQLINIIKGDMTFIGPRPERLFFVDKYSKEVNGYNERFKVKPGLTGLAQIHGDYHSSPQNKLRYDLTYIYNYSILLDIIIIIETIKIIITRKGN
jgi:exopolysaccharide biosynthesis polyprenyl glycosylphosphotransferase